VRLLHVGGDVLEKLGAVFLAGTMALLQGQIAGFYEPADRTMYLVDDLDEREAEETLAHELVHALQDQRWDIARFMKFKLGESDKIGAAHAVIEGDATVAMIDASGTPSLDIPPEALKRSLLASAISSKAAASTPRVLLSSLVAPYAVRPADGAPVSTPITWDELDDPELRSDRWTIRTVVERVERLGDLFAAAQSDRQELPPL
jgi:hypothetical protein